MERITSHQVVGLMEAYAAVHAPQINEEQVWEEVETWVNSLVEEGYDLSEYSWEDMYEAYVDQLNESYLEELTVAQKDTKIKSQLNTANSEMIRRGGVTGSISRGLTSMFGSQKDIDKNKASDKASDARVRQSGAASVGKYYSSSDNKTYANYNDAKAAKNSRMGVLGIQQGLQRTFRAGGGDAAVAGTPTRPAQTPLAVMGQGATNLQRQQRPAAPAPARPAATAPARPAAPAAARPAAPTPARPGAPKPATAAPAAARPAAATTGNPPLRPPALPPVPGRESLASQAAELRAMQAASRQRQGLTQSFDVFDVIKGHLIDEGYADTEEAALKIMANMSEEWKESIVEAGRMHSASDQQASWHSQNTSNNSKQKSDKEIENEKGGKEFLERIKKTKKNPKYKA